MFDIANNTEFLKAIGIADLPGDQKAKLVAGMEDLAQKRLIVKISDKITEKQADEFSAINDQREAYNWLMTNLPDFPLMMADVLEEMKSDILQHKTKAVGN